MKKSPQLRRSGAPLRRLVFGLGLASALLTGGARAAPLLLPAPASMTVKGGELVLPPVVRISTPTGDRAGTSDARWLADETARIGRLKLRPGAGGQIRFSRSADPSLGP